MPAVEAINLKRSFFTSKKEPGMIGSIKGLFSREKVEVEAVKGINLSVEQGEFVGFLGPNGAGKTTTLKMLSGILHPTGGSASVLGYEPWKRSSEMLRQISLVMGNKNQLWWDLPAWESFVVYKELYEVPDAEFKERSTRLIKLLDLEDKIHTQVRRLSLGERMKCELVAALLHRPRVVFLDEPTIGLDVVSQKRIRDFLREVHHEDNCTFLLTSHYMQDVEELCDRVVVIDHGSLIFEGTLETLSAKFSNVRQVRLVFNQKVLEADLGRYGTVKSFTEDEAVIEVEKRTTAQAVGGILAQFPVRDVAIEDVDIDSVIRQLFEDQAPAQ